MTTFTPIRRHRPLFETACHGNCNQGRSCTCKEAADSGDTLAQEIALHDQEQAALFLEHAEELQRRARPLVWAICAFVVAAAVVAVLW